MSEPDPVKAMEDPIPLSEEPAPVVTPAGGAADPAPAPLSPAPSGDPSRTSGRGSLLGVEGDSCPKCGAPLQPGDIVCLRCGYDLKANVVRTVETKVEDPSEHAPEPFVTAGGGTPKLWGILGGILTVAAMIVAGINAPHGTSGGFLVAVGAIFLVVYSVVVHTGTGLVAVAAAARICEQPFGVLELAVARVFAAFSLFELIINLHIPLGWRPLNSAAAFVLAAGAYYLAVWGLFRKNRTVTLLIVLAHLVLWMVFVLGVDLAGYVNGQIAQAAQQAAPQAGPQ